jgi:hypothetical protein
MINIASQNNTTPAVLSKSHVIANVNSGDISPASKSLNDSDDVNAANKNPEYLSASIISKIAKNHQQNNCVYIKANTIYTGYTGYAY